MSLTPAELDRVLAELTPLVGARLQKVAQPAPLLVVLEIRLPGRSLLLQLCAASGAGRLTVVDTRPPSPAKPYAFQGLLRSRLAGAQLAGFERQGPTAAGLVFATPEGRRTLVCEWDGRTGDLALLDAEGRLLHAAGERLRARGLGRGAPYAPQTGPAAVVSLSGGGEAPAAATSSGPPAFPISKGIEARYRQAAGLASGDGERLLAPLRRRLRQLERTRDAVRGDLVKAEEAGTLRRRGDLLKPHLASLRRGQREAVVTEWTAEGPVEVRVPLLPHLSPHENVARLFHQHRRLTEARGRIGQRLAEIDSRLARCGALLEDAASGHDPARAEAAVAAARAEGLLREPALRGSAGVAAEERLPYREFTGHGGRRVWVGRGSRDNDALTFRLGRGHDLWLHARGIVGAHVVVPGQGPGEPDGELLLDAATLAAHFSGARGEPVVDVAWTRCRHVRRRKDAMAGAVLYTHDRTLVVRVEPGRLSRLLSSETVR